ncbi:MAG: DNA -binding domain-containing protein [Bacillota bacterium]
MDAKRIVGQDWRDAGAYAPLLEADRPLFAWEWLRRDPRYAEAAAVSEANPAYSGGAARFGLLSFEDPALSVPHARPLWGARADPYVLAVGLRGDREPGDRFDARRFGALATIAADEREDHLLLSDGLRAVRLDGPAGAFKAGPRCLAYRLHGIAAAQRPLLTLRRFLALCRRGRFSRLLHRREPRARRWILMLRAYDALSCGATQRDIAEQLFSRSAGAPRWRSREASVRSQAQRLVRSVREFSSGGYRKLLR